MSPSPPLDRTARRHAGRHLWGTAVLLAVLSVPMYLLMVSPPARENHTDLAAASSSPARRAVPVPAPVEVQRAVLLAPPAEATAAAPAPAERWSLLGRVVDADTREPVRGFKLVWSADHEARIAGSRQVLDEEGRFEFALPSAGPWTLQVHGQGEYEEVTVPAVTLPGEGPVVVFLPRATMIEGTIRDASGSPAGGVQVSLLPGHAWPGGIPPKWSLAVTDSSGRFRFRDLFPGSYTLRALYHEVVLGEVSSVHVEPGSRIVQDLTVARTNTLHLRVLDASGDPVARARVSLRFESGDVAARSGRTSSEGQVALRYLPHGRITLRVAAGGFEVFEGAMDLHPSSLDHEVTCQLAETPDRRPGDG